MTHKALIGAALAVTSAPLVRKLSQSQSRPDHRRSLSQSGGSSGVSSPASPAASSSPSQVRRG